MAALKKSVRLSDHAVSILTAINGHGNVNWSGSITSLSEQFTLLVEHCLPAMTEAQKQALTSCYEGYQQSDFLSQELSMMPWVITQKCASDKAVLDLLGGQAKADDFISTVKNWNEAQRLAAIYEAKASKR